MQGTQAGTQGMQAGTQGTQAGTQGTQIKFVTFFNKQIKNNKLNVIRDARDANDEKIPTQSNKSKMLNFFVVL